MRKPAVQARPTATIPARGRNATPVAAVDGCQVARDTRGWRNQPANSASSSSPVASDSTAAVACAGVAARRSPFSAGS
jgi:hypothetical protein